jgi:hypothetical protein
MLDLPEKREEISKDIGMCVAQRPHRKYYNNLRKLRDNCIIPRNLNAGVKKYILFYVRKSENIPQGHCIIPPFCINRPESEHPLQRKLWGNLIGLV